MILSNFRDCYDGLYISRNNSFFRRERKFYYEDNDALWDYCFARLHKLESHMEDRIFISDSSKYLKSVRLCYLVLFNEVYMVVKCPIRKLMLYPSVMDVRKMRPNTDYEIENGYIPILYPEETVKNYNKYEYIMDAQRIRNIVNNQAPILLVSNMWVEEYPCLDALGIQEIVSDNWIVQELETYLCDKVIHFDVADEYKIDQRGFDNKSFRHVSKT